MKVGGEEEVKPQPTIKFHFTIGLGNSDLALHGKYNHEVCESTGQKLCIKFCLRFGEVGVTKYTASLLKFCYNVGKSKSQS